MERVEQLEQEHRDLMLGFKFQHAQGKGDALMKDQDAYFAKLHRSEKGLTTASPMPLDVMLRFPGFVNYKKGPVS